MSSSPIIYIASALLEKNRWGSHLPSFTVSDWSARFAEAGFDGIELGDYHLLDADKREREAVLTGPCPVRVLNTYCSFDKAGAASRAASAELAAYLSATAVKFNFGNDHGKTQEYVDNFSLWIEELPAGCRVLCEGHADTILEEPETAVRLLAPLHGKVEYISHAFAKERNALRRRLDAFGDDLSHIHVWFGDKTVAAPRIEMLRNAGFTGTWTIEFCKGVDQPPEDMEKLFATAIEDQRFLRKELA